MGATEPLTSQPSSLTAAGRLTSAWSWRRAYIREWLLFLQRAAA